MPEIQHVKTSSEIESCWAVVHALRPHLREENFVEQVQEMMKEGYKMICIMENKIACAFAGFRNMHMLYNGKTIYIDDLSTLPEYRGKGYAGMLLDYIHDMAKREGKTAVTLDSGYNRNDAHRLYLNKGYILASHHFSKRIE